MSGSTVIIINESRRAALPDDERERLDKLVAELETIVDPADDDDDNGDDSG